MAQPIAYYKGTKLGDLLKGPVEREATIAGAQFLRSGWANLATPIQSGAGASYRFTVRAFLLRGSSETLRQFEGRKLDLLRDVRTLGGYATNTYAQRGDLVVFEDDDDDFTTAPTAPTIGSNIEFTVAESIGVAASDYVYIRTSSSIYEICTVTAVDGLDITVSSVSGSHVDNCTVARVLWYLPNAYLQAGPRIPGHDPGTMRHALDLDFVFESAEDPVDHL